MSLVQEDERLVECLHDIGNVAGRSLVPTLGLDALGLDALLLGTQNLFGDNVAVVELEKLLLLGVELGQPGA